MEGSFISSDLIPPFEGRRKQIRMNVSRLHSAVTFSSCPVTAHRRWVVSAILCTTVVCTVIGATEHTSAAGAQGSSADWRASSTGQQGEASSQPQLFSSGSSFFPPALACCAPTALCFCICTTSGCCRLLPLSLRQTQTSMQVSGILGHFLPFILRTNSDRPKVQS